MESLKKLNMDAALTYVLFQQSVWHLQSTLICAKSESGPLVFRHEFLSMAQTAKKPFISGGSSVGVLCRENAVYPRRYQRGEKNLVLLPLIAVSIEIKHCFCDSVREELYLLCR